MIGRALGGAVRNLAATARSAVTDVVTGAAYLGDLVTDRVADRDPGDAVLRVAVLILSDQDGPLTSEAAVLPSLTKADAILRQQAGIGVRTVSVRTVREPAPVTALDPRANQKLLLDDMMGRTDLYRRYLPAGSGVGAPVTVVVVRDIAGRTTGCSLGMTADWVICQRSLFDADNPNAYDDTVLAHEIGHALNLPHHSDPQNLMFPTSSPPGAVRGTELRRWQALVLNANRHTIPAIRSSARP
ncbi:matrixin family metalloprotease [Nakamurella lactea]|jgi:hypothetical protein|uniref:matrixin family metalloprotease n=1 Tax=Nakamurella lactea TaxID=459515 RepID=UPI00048B7092|nr:matrixin family metalloprotease [Nakamurella lactea]